MNKNPPEDNAEKPLMSEISPSPSGDSFLRRWSRGLQIIFYPILCFQLLIWLIDLLGPENWSTDWLRSGVLIVALILAFVLIPVGAYKLSGLLTLQQWHLGSMEKQARIPDWISWASFLFVIASSLIILVLTRFHVPANLDYWPVSQLQRIHDPTDDAGRGVPQIIGHRGSMETIEGIEVGNTFRTIQHAIDHQVDWIEVDVQRAGGELVLFHDKHINGELVGDMALSDLKASDFYRRSHTIA